MDRYYCFLQHDFRYTENNTRVDHKDIATKCFGKACLEFFKNLILQLIFKNLILQLISVISISIFLFQLFKLYFQTLSTYEYLKKKLIPYIYNLHTHIYKFDSLYEKAYFYAYEYCSFIID